MAKTQNNKQNSGTKKSVTKETIEETVETKEVVNPISEDLDEKSNIIDILSEDENLKDESTVKSVDDPDFNVFDLEEDRLSILGEEIEEIPEKKEVIPAKPMHPVNRYNSTVIVKKFK